MIEPVTIGGWHFQHFQSLVEVETCTREQRALFDFLQVKTIYPDESFNLDDFALYPDWNIYKRQMRLYQQSNKKDNQNDKRAFPLNYPDCYCYRFFIHGFLFLKPA
jgi:hypothetical protein